MKKEKWLVGEIDRWREMEIVSEETASALKGMYSPKKSIGFLTVLLSVVGCLLIGMGIVLLSANNWWYALPVAVRTIIGFMPLVISQAVMVYVMKFKKESVAFREGAALLNMAGVFAVVALVGQIFHLPGDFTNYLLVCGTLSMPSMLLLKAASPLIIFYWTTINGGIFYDKEIGIIIALLMLITGAVYAFSVLKGSRGKNVYLAFITAVTGFLWVMLSFGRIGSNISIVLGLYIVILLACPAMSCGVKDVFEVMGRIGFVVMTSVFTYSGIWSYSSGDFGNSILTILSILAAAFALLLLFKAIKEKRLDIFTVFATVTLLLRTVWSFLGLTDSPFDAIFVIIFNLILLFVSVWCIVDGAKRVDLYNANTGMITLCTLIVMRFFDSEMPLYVRGIAFVVIGAGFLIFNLYLVKSRKSEKGDSV